MGKFEMTERHWRETERNLGEGEGKQQNRKNKEVIYDGHQREMRLDK